MNYEELKQREGHPAGYYEAVFDGKKYSVVDFGTTMKSAPNFEALRSAGMFLGWEAMRVRANGTLDADEMYRANCYEDLKEKLL